MNDDDDGVLVVVAPVPAMKMMMGSRKTERDLREFIVMIGYYCMCCYIVI